MTRCSQDSTWSWRATNARKVKFYRHILWSTILEVTNWNFVHCLGGVVQESRKRTADKKRERNREDEKEGNNMPGETIIIEENITQNGLRRGEPQQRKEQWVAGGLNLFKICVVCLLALRVFCSPRKIIPLLLLCLVGGENDLIFSAVLRCSAWALFNF